MSDSINAIGASMTTGLTQSTVDVAAREGVAAVPSNALRLMTGESLTVTTMSGVVTDVIKQENNTPEGMQKSEVQAGKSPVKKDVFFNVAGEQVVEHA